MKRINKRFLYVFGGFLAFVFKFNRVFANTTIEELDLTSRPIPMPAYGMPEPEAVESNFWEKILSVLFSPIFIVTIIVLAFIIGIVIFIKKKKKAKNISNK